MKKWMALLLAAALMLCATGAMADSLSAKQRYNFNLFLSNFTEQGFCRGEDESFDIDRRDTIMMTEFAVEHCWFNRQNRLEWGEYFGGNNVRLPEDQIAPIVKKYFGVKITPSHDLRYIDYRKGYYYWEETGGHTSDGFACLTGVDNLGGGRYSVDFLIFGMGEDWNNDVCYYTTDEAARAYPPYGDSPSGWAIIDTGNSSDRADWRLVYYNAYYYY